MYTFYVVARCGAMHLAADELGVTPGAVSQRIRSVEERHGRRLFDRSRSGISLTKSGETLWQEVEDAFGRIEQADQRYFTSDSDPQIRISATPTFAHSLLVPRLGEFSKAHPNIEMSIETDARLVDLRSEPIDVAIRHGLGNYVGYKSEWLSSPELIVVGSPALLKNGPVIEESEDCLHYPLLRDSTRQYSDWDLWCEARGVDGRNARYGPSFKGDFLIVKAAVEGQGLALLSDVYVKEELRSNQLVKACKAAWPVNFAYYAVALPVTFERPAIKSFIAWLKDICRDNQEGI